MIGWLQGAVVALDRPATVVDVGGVGYRVTVTDAAYDRLAIGERVAFHVSTQVRDNAIDLYGFGTLVERQVFESLLKINSVGTRTARQILSTYTPAELVDIGKKGDVARLKRVSGVGPKTAERIVLELKDAIDEDLIARGGPDGGAVAEGDVVSEAMGALIQLGFVATEAMQRIRKAIDGKPAPVSVDELVRNVLQQTGA